MPVEPLHHHSLVCAAAKGLAEAEEGAGNDEEAKPLIAEYVEDEGDHVKDEAQQKLVLLPKELQP